MSFRRAVSSPRRCCRMRCLGRGRTPTCDPFSLRYVHLTDSVRSQRSKNQRLLNAALSMQHLEELSSMVLPIQPPVAWEDDASWTRFLRQDVSLPLLPDAGASLILYSAGPKARSLLADFNFASPECKQRVAVRGLLLPRLLVLTRFAGSPTASTPSLLNSTGVAATRLPISREPLPCFHLSTSRVRSVSKH
jgi:hypothetical protein